MSIGREIRSKITSISNTQKITGAMELVAASKMRKAQDRMLVSRPYAGKIRQVVSHIATSHSEYHHPYLMQREETKRVGFIVVSTDRGLCGGLNINLFRKTLGEMRKWRDKGAEIDLCLIGRKASSFFSRFGGNIVGKAEQLGDSPSISDLIGVVKVMLDAYNEERIDAVYLLYNRFVNTMNQVPEIEQLLPIEIKAGDGEKYHWDYLYEPDAKELLTDILVRYIETQVYQAVVDNLACEQAARMVAMKSATDNANELIDELKIIYNKARQAAITQEISEIVSGAQAIE